MEEDNTSQFYKALPLEVYVKFLNNFHLQGKEIAARYEELICRLKRQQLCRNRQIVN